jgi:hypothetical protein
MSYRAWNEHFNRDPTLVGTTFTLNSVRGRSSLSPPHFLPEAPTCGCQSRSRTPTCRPMALSPLPRAGVAASITSGRRGSDANLCATRKRSRADYPNNYGLTGTFRTASSAISGMLYALMAASRCCC